MAVHPTGDGVTGEAAPAPGAQASGESPPPPTSPPPGPAHRPPSRSASVVALVLLLILVACGIGVGIGYAIHGLSSNSTVAPRVTTSGGTSGRANASTSAIAAKVVPALVNIDATFAYETAQGAGTGMVVTSSGRVITNNHVIAGATSITATDLGNGKTYHVSVVGYDAAHDVAVLQLDGASALHTVSFASSPVHLGDTVVAIGNAGGKGTPSAARGVVTGLGQSVNAYSELSGTTEHLSGLIETDAAIQSGQSGGPLVNAHARVVGMVTAGSSNYSFNDSASQGYAVPTAAFRAIAADVVNGNESGTVHVGATAFLGVRLTAVQEPGAFVVQVVATSPAAAAGIAAGDLIVGLNGTQIRSPDTLASVLAALNPGARARVQVVDQAGVERTVTVTLVAGPPA